MVAFGILLTGILQVFFAVHTVPQAQWWVDFQAALS